MKRLILTSMLFSALLIGCQSLKVDMRPAQLEAKSTSRVQFMISGVGAFKVSPGTDKFDWNNDKSGVAASDFWHKSMFFSDEDIKFISENNIGMPKYDNTQSRYYSGISDKAVPFINEHYVKPHETLSFIYGHISSQSSCTVSGNFMPLKNTDYRLTGVDAYGKCMVALHKITSNADGSVKLVPLKIK